MRASNKFVAGILVRIPIDLAADEPQIEAVDMLLDIIKIGLASRDRLPTPWDRLALEADEENGVITLRAG